MRVNARKVLQVLHDLAHSRDALFRLGHQRGDVFLQEVELDAFAQCFERCCDGRARQCGFGGFVSGEHLEQVAKVFFKHAEIREDVADRVVDLVRHTGRQLADGCELLGLHELVLSLRQLDVELLQRFVGQHQFVHLFLGQCGHLQRRSSGR